MARAFEPVLIRRGTDVLRASRVFLDPDGKALLVEMLAVEAGRKQPFYGLAALHDRGSVTVRVDPMTHPERTAGVRALIDWLAGRVIECNPGSKIERSNLEPPDPSP